MLRENPRYQEFIQLKEKVAKKARQAQKLHNLAQKQPTISKKLAQTRDKNQITNQKLI